MTVDEETSLSIPLHSTVSDRVRDSTACRRIGILVQVKQETLVTADYQLPVATRVTIC